MYYRNWLTLFWRLRSPRAALWKLEPQENQWYNSVWVWRPKNQGRLWCKPRSSKAQEPRTVMSQGRGRWMPQFKKGENSPIFCLCVPFGPSADWMTPIHIDDGGPLSSVYWIKWNALTDTTRNSVWPDLWASLTPVKLTHQINHHNK